MDIKNRQIGVITLNRELTIDEVTEIFIRINSQGAKLNQADFAMSKIAANTNYGGNILRKAIDYFSHLAIQPDWYGEMCRNTEFMATPFANKLKWLKDDREDMHKNMEQNCIPADIIEMEYTNYDSFLNERRKLMAQKIKAYYHSL